MRPFGLDDAVRDADDEENNPANSEELLGLLEQWKEHAEELATLRYQFKSIRRVHGPGPHVVSPGVSIVIAVSGKPKQV